MGNLARLVDDAGDAVRRIVDAGDFVPVSPVPNRWFLEPESNQRVQGLVQRVLDKTGLDRQAFHSGAFVDPMTGEILDGRIFASGAVNSFDGRKPAMVVSGGTPVASQGPLFDANLVRRKGLWTSEDIEQPFIATVENSGAGHFYGKGIDYQVPVLLNNNMGGRNPTLRPRARGSLYGTGNVGLMTTSQGKTHPVYDLLRVVSRDPSGPRAPGTMTEYGKLLKYSLLAPAVLSE